MVAGLDQVRAELILVGLLLVAACDRPRPEDGRGRSAVGVVDSILPPGEALRRFRAGLDTPTRLDGAPSRDELVNRFLTAVRQRDAEAVRSLAVTRAEYAYLVYPELSISRPPYNQPPETAWLLLDAETSSGVSKLVNAASSRFELLGYRCTAAPIPVGALRLHSDCTVRVRESGAERDVRLFGRIIERDGRWKLMSVGGDL